jgi:hypothetical protein
VLSWQIRSFKFLLLDMMPNVSVKVYLLYKVQGIISQFRDSSNRGVDVLILGSSHVNEE